MLSSDKCNILGVLINAVDYRESVIRIIQAAQKREPLGVSALAVHGLMTGVLDAEQRYRLNHLELVTPDGQPVRWLINLLYGKNLRDRVYGPSLTLKVLEAAAQMNLPVYFYGSSASTVAQLKERMERRFPGLRIAGHEPSKFRAITPVERQALVERIVGSGARIVLVGLGCPRQEVFAYELKDRLGMPVMAVGAAFDYHAGVLTEPPMILQTLGLQWFYRLCQEPRRLAKRYVVLNSQFLLYAFLQVTNLWQPDPNSAYRPKRELLFG